MSLPEPGHYRGGAGQDLRLRVGAYQYVLVTPVRDEKFTIEETIRSVQAQTVLPQEWVIVSDGSTDGTDELVKKYSSAHPWIRLVRREDIGTRSFASVVDALDFGLQHLNCRDYSFLGFLDGDVRFQGDYFEQLLQRFADSRELGLGGGLVVDMIGGRRVRSRQHLEEVAGAVQFFRRECLEALGGLVPIPEGGWDTITAVGARMRGFKTRTFPDLLVEHLKPRNSAEGGPVRRMWQMGVRDYAVGNHPVFEWLKCAATCMYPPLIIGGLARLMAYCSSQVSRRPRRVAVEVVGRIRREQIRRIGLRGSFSLK